MSKAGFEEGYSPEKRPNNNFLKIDEAAALIHELKINLYSSRATEDFKKRLRILYQEIEGVFESVENTSEMPSGSRSAEVIHADVISLVREAFSSNYVKPKKSQKTDPFKSFVPSAGDYKVPYDIH